MPLTPGAKLGPYEILSALGAGGMGEVYEALDTRLDRHIALKVLLAAKVSDPERKRRFIQEAKAASALNHPNIVVIYDIGTEAGVDYMAMELVPGMSLDQTIPRNGLRISELLRYSVQIADALAKAHAAGIVHRDLKPGNVMATPDGLIKVLDFGLAKLTQSSKDEPHSSPTDEKATRSIVVHTDEGTIVGTAAYMSPEQAEGKIVDGRSDLFSFGAMLYEMATGQRAFRGDTQMATLSAVMRDEPAPVNQVRPDIPQELNRIVTRCLRKDPARRFQHASDLKVALEELKDEWQSGTLTGPAPTQAAAFRVNKWVWGAAGVLVLAGALGGYFLTKNSPGSSDQQASSVVMLTTYPGDQARPSFSPDGNQVAFDWNGENLGNFDIYVKLIDSGTPLRLTTDPALDYGPSWSPDGKSIAFLRWIRPNRVAVMVVPPLGGAERKIGEFYTDVFAANPTARLCWMADSKGLVVSAFQAAAARNRLLLISTETGDLRALTDPPPQTFDWAPRISADGRTVAFLRFNGTKGSLFSIDLSEKGEARGEPREIPVGDLDVQGAAWNAGRRELIIRAGPTVAASRLYRVAVDGSGAPVPILEAGQGVSSADVSPKGNRLVYARSFQDTNIWAVSLTDRKGAPQKRVPSSLREVSPQYSPDLKRLVFSSDRGGSVQIWTCNVDGSACQQVTSMPGPISGTPRWSPDGRKISFDSNTDRGTHIFIADPNGGKPRQMTSGDGINIIASWSRDGKWIYFGSDRSGRLEIWKVGAEGGDPVQVTHDGGTAALESPDGMALYYTRNDGLDGIWKMPVEGGTPVQMVKSVFRYNFAVTPKGIYYTPQRNADGSSSVQFLNFSTNATTEIAKIEKVVDLGLAVSPDERELLYAQIDFRGTNLMLIENFR